MTLHTYLTQDTPAAIMERARWEMEFLRVNIQVNTERWLRPADPVRLEVGAGFYLKGVADAHRLGRLTGKSAQTSATIIEHGLPDILVDIYRSGRIEVIGLIMP